MAAASASESEAWRGSEPLLPSDVILSILLRLPVKTLSRLRCVSKSWSSLISSPYFRSRYRGSRRNLIIFITCEEEERCVNNIQTLDMQGRPLRRELLDSCPYIGVALSSLDLVCAYGVHDIYIRNPTTGEQITLPNSPSQCSKRRHKYRGRLVSFGRASSTSDYKVVQVVKPVNLDGAITCEVFSLRSRDWRVIGSPPFRLPFHKMVVADGAVHLLPRYPFTRRVRNGEPRGIIRFDLEKEEWSVHPLPGPYNFSPYPMKVSLALSPLGGRLCLECSGNKRLELWFQRGDDRNEWAKEYDIDVSELGCFVSQTLAIEEDGRVLLKLRDGRLQCYDPKDGRFQEIYDAGANFGGSLYDAGTNFSVSLYVESSMRLNDY